MNEIRSRIISYAAAPESQGRVPKLQSRCTRKADIDRFREHMKTVLRHADRVRPEILVARRRSISADDVNLGVGAAHGSGGIRQNVENPRVVVMHLSGTVVAEEMVELRQSLGNVGIAVAIHDIQMFPGMRVVKPQVALRNRRRSTGYGNVGKNRKQGKNANTQNVYLGTLISRRQGRTFSSA
jgi:hypothetical protein